MTVVDSRLSSKLANMSIVCAVLVCCIHTNDGGLIEAKNAFVSCVCRIAVPYFFVCSGFLLARRMEEDGWWRCAIKKRVHSLFVPYLVWSSLYFVFSSSVRLCANIVAGASLLRNFPRGWQNLRWFGLDPFALPEMITLWYVRSLIILILISPLLMMIVRSRLGWVWIFVWYLVSLVSNPEMFLIELLPPISIVTFCLGIMLWFHPVRVNRILKIVIVLFAVSLCVIMAFTEGFEQDPSRTLIARIAMPFVLLSVWFFMPMYNCPSWMTSCTFGVYLVHVFPVCILGITIPFIPYPIACAIIVILSVVIVNLCKSMLPWSKRFLFGGR